MDEDAYSDDDDYDYLQEGDAYYPPCCMRSHLNWVAMRDDTAEFSRVMQISKGSWHLHNLSVSIILEKLIRIKAVKCVTMLLAGDQTLPFSIHLNYPLQLESGDQGDFPLHVAAARGNHKIVDLFLLNGARTDARNVNNFIPLDAALQSLHSHSYLEDWTLDRRKPHKSIFELLCRFCQPRLSDKLKTITLLAWSTNEVNNIFKHHVKEGNLIEMAALLISAHECVMAPSTLQNKDGLAINGNMAYLQCIKESMWLETIEKMESLGRLRTMSKPAWKRRAKFMALESALYLLKLFERVGVAIRSYIGSQPSNVTIEMAISDVTTILRRAGYRVTESDIHLRITNWLAPDGIFKSFCHPHSLAKDIEEGRQRSVNGLHESLASNRSNYLQNRGSRPWGMQVDPMMCNPPDQSGTYSIRHYSCSTSRYVTKARFNGQTNRTHRPMSASMPKNILAFLALALKKGARH